MGATPRHSSSDNNAIRFLLDGEVMVLQDVDPTMTILTYLRDDLRRTGTKEGCAEGDCGACTLSRHMAVQDLRARQPAIPAPSFVAGSLMW